MSCIMYYGNKLVYTCISVDRLLLYYYILQKYIIFIYYYIYTLSGRIVKVVASHAGGCRVDSRLRLHQCRLCHIKKFQCNLAHRRSVAILGMLYKIRCNPLPSLYGALHVPVRVTLSAVACDRTSVDLCASSLQDFAV